MGLGGRKRKADYPGCFDHGQRQSRPGRGRGGAGGAISNAGLGGRGEGGSLTQTPRWVRLSAVPRKAPTLPSPIWAKWDDVERGAEGPARAELRSRCGRKEAAWNAGWTELRLDVLQSAGFESLLGKFLNRFGPGLSCL